MKIKSPEDIQTVSDKIIGQLVKNRLTYFSIMVDEEDISSSCFFSPVTKTSKNQSMIMVEDYEKILKLLLSHPKVSDIEYDEKGNVISAVFQNPYPIEGDGEWR